MKKLITQLLYLSFFGLTFVACEEEEAKPDYTIPATYEFENVNYSGQTQRLAMLSEMKSYMTTGNTPNTVLDANRLKAMYANDAALSGWKGTYDAGKQLKDKTFEAERAKVETWMDGLAKASQSVVPASEGKAGVATSTDGTKKYLVNANGLEYAQLIEKGLMGACFYYQTTAVYMGADRMNVDNETVVPGEGTKMEHHWDEAFGYLGVPTTFPVTTDGLAFWGVYINRRDPVLESNEPFMNAMITGRAAISNNDLETRDEAITEARKWFELVVATTAINYINTTLKSLDDLAIRFHSLSEGIAFIYSLQFNPDKKLTNAQVEELFMLLGGSKDINAANFYQTSKTNLEEAKAMLAKAYGVEDKADLF